MSTVIARQVTKAVTPLMLLASLNFFLQGHNLPGGGFIAGVMTAAAVSLVYIVFDFDGIEEMFGIHGETHLVRKYLPTSEFGLILAVGSGLLSIGLGLNFLQHRHGELHLPLFGKIHWTTALIFDLGVYLAVFGSLMVMVEVLGEE